MGSADARRVRLASWFLLAALSPLAGPARAADCDGAREEVVIEDVTEDLEFRLEDGRLARLAGLDLPSAARGAPALTEAIRADVFRRATAGPATLANLAAKKDRWGRMIANIYVEDAAGPAQSLALALLAAGDARVRPEFETRGCVLERLAEEGPAIAAGLGVWRDPDYAVIAATDANALRQNDGRFVVVEGQVKRIGLGSSRIYLDFGEPGGLAAVISRKSEGIFEKIGMRVRDLTGARLRIRGALDLRFEPRIEVDGVGGLERLDASTLRGAAAP